MHTHEGLNFCFVQFYKKNYKGNTSFKFVFRKKTLPEVSE